MYLPSETCRTDAHFTAVKEPSLEMTEGCLLWNNANRLIPAGSPYVDLSMYLPFIIATLLDHLFR